MTEEQLSSNHPTLPPTTEEDRFSWLRLLRSRKVGPATFRRLLREHGSAQNALAALPEMARAAGIKGYEICPPGVIEAELKAAKAANARLLCLGAADFPTALNDLNDAPPMLWAVGNVSLLQNPSVAMVGARNCSSLGARMARGLATDLGKHGYVIVSGLARGIDTAAHIAALDAGTVAVMAGGVDVIYPSENTDLAHKIAENGLRVSEQPMGVTPQARHFPRRNRIISGLSQAVVVVEAAAKSGSLITARDALDQGREVLAVPGHPFDARAAGCNLLIRDGATLIRSAEDVIEALPKREIPALIQAAQPPRTDNSEASAESLHAAILTRLGPSPIAEDQLIRDIAATAGEIGPVLVDLELDGRIQRQPGGLLSLSA
ncbi:DNA protecting protein DprA [Ruegeria sp. THAF57]|uniref:DNA-processing protein DprA n=1 Tax=Ruegeria sp. THAF57 TaxID=2744555 RepID=UPI0015DFA93B|nr:DNA-processing protein DprA [Ruegeria sp. THAF57]CAD0184879.1 DNA protecting protein DprA [Ruegeria sp. THAF57]